MRIIKQNIFAYCETPDVKLYEVHKEVDNKQLIEWKVSYMKKGIEFTLTHKDHISAANLYLNLQSLTTKKLRCK